MADDALNSFADRIVSDPGEVAFVVHSSVDRPIRELSFLQRALLFAELSMISYNDKDEAERAANLAGFDDVTFYDRDGSQAYRFRNQHDCVIACRGTEPNEWNDIQADANAAVVVAETVGRVHRGFKREVDDLWPMLETALMSNEQPLWFCGHSLGGAMATICSGRCFLSHIDSNPEQLFTYGSPRVGDNRYVNYVKLQHFRFVNNNDAVTRVPPFLLGYRHCGNEVYLDRNGKIRKLGRLMKRRDRWRGFLSGLWNWKIDHFSDHSIHRYIKAIESAVEAEKADLAAGGVAKTSEYFAGTEREWTEEPDSKTMSLQE
ncbi:lipase family protein [Novipirellula artificiosorum]|uniref:Lipase (Class 3) n=1 Tax=Novipirellula artificiosorum TaxID=2528016 RepID=A0A5C6DXA8_9BACT|nr:lipase family protein [Novipirellula artificiosorum]TWU40527.1 Lipase (class 3) [Novipirellula artificiosorum]